jgi:chromate reductase
MFKLLSLLLLSITTTPACTHATEKPKVLAFAGSTRTDSLNKKLILDAAAIATELGADVTVLDLKQYPIPLYDGDDEAEGGMPENARRIRQLMIDSQVILIASPDYNRSYSAVLKNVLDWASRTEDADRCKLAYKGKKFVIMCTSGGGSGGVKGLPQLRFLLGVLGGDVVPGDLAIPKGNSAFDPSSGQLQDPQLRAALRAHIQQALTP